MPGLTCSFFSRFPSAFLLSFTKCWNGNPFIHLDPTCLLNKSQERGLVCDSPKPSLRSSPPVIPPCGTIPCTRIWVFPGFLTSGQEFPPSNYPEGTTPWKSTPLYLFRGNFQGSFPASAIPFYLHFENKKFLGVFFCFFVSLVFD